MASLDAIPLDIDEGVPLGHALVARLAVDHGIRVLGIKGPTLERLGCRPPRRSLDVDVLVEPARFKDLLEALESAGWVAPAAAQRTGGHVLPPHSVPVAHAGWPAEIDVHHYFPGFLAPASDVFEALWRNRTSVDLAGQPVAVPCRPAAAAIALLHLLRSGERRAEEYEALLRRLDSSLTAGERQSLARVAAETGAEGPLADSLHRLRAGPLRRSKVDTDAVMTWELTRGAAGGHTVGWLVTFRQTPLARWPSLLWRALWLTEAELRVRYPAARAGRVGLMGMWLDRWWTGLKAAPRAVRLIRDHRHDPGESWSDRTGS